MSQVEEIVELLGSLAQSDRSWIIERLSPAAQARLAERIASTNEVTERELPQGSAEQGAASAATHELEQCVARIAAADASIMLRVLHDEPAWLIKMVLQLSDWPWRKMFLQSLSSRMRFDVTGVLTNQSVLGGAARSRLLRELSGRVAAMPSESRPDSRFAALLARATGKAAQR